MAGLGLYSIDYKNGTTPLGELPIGAKVVDPTWSWEFRTGLNYGRRQGDTTKQVVWVVVAKNHYKGIENHVTLITEELIGLCAFDNSTKRGHTGQENGHNHWGKSGTDNAKYGLRAWLNSTGSHSKDGFLNAFSDNFKSAILTTTIENPGYSTQDKVFIPSTAELGGNIFYYSYELGEPYRYFLEPDEKYIDMDILKMFRRGLANDYTGTLKAIIRIAKLKDKRLEDKRHWYWTRTPGSVLEYFVRIVDRKGDLSPGSDIANIGDNGARPVVNVKFDLKVTRPDEG